MFCSLSQEMQIISSRIWKWYLQVFYFIFFFKFIMVNIKIILFLLTYFNSFLNYYLFFKFFNKFWKEILRCVLPSSHVCDFYWGIQYFRLLYMSAYRNFTSSISLAQSWAIFSNFRHWLVRDAWSLMLILIGNFFFLWLVM